MSTKPSRVKHLRRAWWALPLVAACVGEIGDAPFDDRPPIGAPVPPFSPNLGSVRRLTSAEYAAAVSDVLGEGAVIFSTPVKLDRDGFKEGLFAVGASVNGVDGYGVENYATVAYDLADQAMSNAALHDALVPCTPAGATDDTCASTVLGAIGRRAFRRPLTSDELARFVGIARQAGVSLNDFEDGLEYSIAAILMSPSFLYRIELGEPAPAESPGELRFDAHELASRLSFFFWNAPPDADLKAVADDGSLLDDAVLAQQVDRMLADPRAREGVRAFFSDMFKLADLDTLNKDPTIFVHFNSEVGPSAREETLRTIEYFVHDLAGDYRDLYTTRTTFINRQLAAIYDVPAPSLTAFARLDYPANSARVGILGQVAFLAGQSHPVSTSAVLRGKFVRKNVLCGEVPDPPPGLNTGIPDATAETPTMRDRVREHFAVASCRGCHQMMDPIGLGFENFDGIGRFRTVENGAVIDPSGSLEGVAYDDARTLGQVIHDHPDTPRCLVRTMYRYATGHIEQAGETVTLRDLTTAFGASGYRVLDLMRLVATSDGFRYASAPEEVP